MDLEKAFLKLEHHSPVEFGSYGTSSNFVVSFVDVILLLMIEWTEAEKERALNGSSSV